jgi:hypothetical protein
MAAIMPTHKRAFFIAGGALLATTTSLQHSGCIAAWWRLQKWSAE